MIVALIGALLILATTLFLAVYVPPNNWDSHVYHLPRVEQWIQNKTIAFYPTHIDRQLYTYPLAELGIAHLRMLSGSDMLFNAVQWTAFLIAALTASLITKLFKGKISHQVVAFLFVLTLPMGILQATTTQNDFVTAMWLSIACLFLLVSRSQPTFSQLAWFSSALALAFLTKATAYFFALPFILWMLFILWQIQRPALVSRTLFIVVIVTALIFTHHYRNIMVYGSPFGQPRVKYTLTTLHPIYYVSNALKNISLHLAAPEVKKVLEQSLVAVHTHVLNVDINDKETSWPGESFKLVYAISEDYISNEVHFISVALVFSFITFSHKARWREHKLLVLVVSCGFVLIVSVLRWQPWATRLHLPLYVLSAPVIGIIIGNFSRWIVLFYCLMLLVTAVPVLILNEQKPFVGGRTIFQKSSEELLFQARRNLRQDYVDSTHFIYRHGFKTVGLYHETDEWEYPVWKLLKELTHDQVQIGNYAVHDQSALTHKTPLTFEAVICLQCNLIERQDVFTSFPYSQEFGSIIVYYQ